MNYLNKIAFLGKRRLQDYAPKPNNWIMVKDFDDVGWTEEFQKIKNLSPTDSVDVESDSYVELGRTDSVIGRTDSVICIRKNQRRMPFEYRYYYNKDLDVLFYITESELREIEPILDLLFNFLEENIPMIFRDVEIKEIPKEWGL